MASLLSWLKKEAGDIGNAAQRSLIPGFAAIQDVNRNNNQVIQRLPQRVQRPLQNFNQSVARPLVNFSQQAPGQVLTMPVNYIRGLADEGANFAVNNPGASPIEFGKAFGAAGFKNSGLPQAGRLFGDIAHQVTGIKPTYIPGFGRQASFTQQAKEQGLGPTALGVGSDLLATGLLASGLRGNAPALGQEPTLKVARTVSKGAIGLNTSLGQAGKAKLPGSDKPSVLQIINTKTGEKTYKTISPKNYPAIKESVDGTAKGIAGKNIGGEVFHITAKTPKQMEAQGFVHGGNAHPNEIPLPPGTPPYKGPAIESGLKTRGFTENIAKSPVKNNPTAKAVVESIPGYKPITNKGTLAKATTEINKNPSAAFARIVTKQQLTSANDVATGNILLRRAIESGDTEAAIDVGTKLGMDGTKLGQAVQAYATFKKTTPEGIVIGASKKAGSAGRELDPAVARELIAKAQNIARMPEGLAKAKATRDLLALSNKQGRTYKDVIGEVLATPKAAMATADLSAPLRQGAVLGSRFPKQFAEASKESVKYFGSPGAYEKAMYEISQRPSYALMKSHKLAVSGAEELSGTEEQFLNNILESKVAKKVGVGHVVAGSDRAYTGFLTKLRADVFDKVVNDYQKSGVPLDKVKLDSLAKFINSASGRGEGNITNQLSRLQVLFSPKLWKSRLDLLNPGYYASLKGPARTLALQSTGSFLGITTTLLGLAKAAGADVGTDPRSADFAKIKVGNTRYDILGGLQQNIRLAAQLITGQKINSETGQLQDLGPERGYGKPSRTDLIYQFIENKENPVISYGTKVLRGTDAGGKPIDPLTEAGKLFVPLSIQGAYDTIKDTGSTAKGLAMNIPGVFGVGVQTYGNEKNKSQAGLSVLDRLLGKSEPQGDIKPLKNGKFEGKVGDEFKVFDNEGAAKKAIFVDKFKKGDQKISEFGNKVYIKNDRTEQGYSVKSKVDYEFDKVESRLNLAMDRAKANNNIQGWLDSAEKKYQALETKKKSYDPDTDQDKIDDITLKQENLREQAEKFQGYGGFTKAKAPKKGKSLASIKTTITKAPKIKGVKVKVAAAKFKAPSVRKLSVSKIPSSYVNRKLA